MKGTCFFNQKRLFEKIFSNGKWKISGVLEPTSDRIVDMAVDLV